MISRLRKIGKRNGLKRHSGSEQAGRSHAHGHPVNGHQPILLGNAKRGYRGIVQAIDPMCVASALNPVELESRLIELGFVEGAKVEILHEGIIGRDPIAVRVDNATIAVRRREAMAVVLA
jgi:ferrous iron transport protein A